MSWTLIEPPEKSEDEDSDFYVISEESTDEEDNSLRQEYHTNRARLRSRKEFEFVELLYSLVVRSFFPVKTFLLKSNHWDPNIVDISGALITLSLSIFILNSQCEEGAGDVNNILFPEIIQCLPRISI